jgi:hypothetical protein
MVEQSELKWYGRGNLVDTHQEQRIINGVLVTVTVCRPEAASGSDSVMSWDEEILLDVESKIMDKNSFKHRNAEGEFEEVDDTLLKEMVN